MSTKYSFRNFDRSSVISSPCHVIRPSVFAFSYAPDNVCHTTLFKDPVCTLSVIASDSYHDSSIFLCVVTRFVKLDVAK